LPENWWQSEICIVINNKPQGSIAKHLSCELVIGYFTTNLSLNLLAKEFLKSVNIWQSYRQNG